VAGIAYLHGHPMELIPVQHFFRMVHHPAAH
jgi:hypothetical protein